MSTLFWDCQTGISGDMAVASLLDLGASEEAVRAALAPLAGEGFELRIGRVEKAGLDCCDFDVVLDELEFLDPKGTTQQGGYGQGFGAPAPQAQQAPAGNDFGPNISDEEIPF